MTAARPLPMSGDPEPMRVWVSVHGSDEHGRPQAKALFHVNARSRESAWALISGDARFAQAEVVYFDEQGKRSRAWRDAVTRQWRTK